MKHLIIIPTYNETENIEKITRQIFKLFPDISILVVDDSSPDGTYKVVNKLQEEYKSLFILSQNKKSGLASAYINGFKWGLKNGYELFTTIDADYSHPPDKIQKARELIESGYDIASGSRYVKQGNTQETDWFKNFISIGGNIYARIILGKNFYDWTEGFNTYTKKALDTIDLDSLKVKGYILHAKMKYKAVKSGLKAIEFPINFAEREKGESKMSANIIIEALITVIKIRLGL